MKKKMNKKGAGIIFSILVLAIIVLLIWGYLGGQEAKKIGITCDLRIGSNFCWKWHENIIGQTGQAINNLLGVK